MVFIDDNKQACIDGSNIRNEMNWKETSGWWWLKPMWNDV